MSNLKSWFLVLAVAFLCGSAGAATLTVSPTTVTDAYRGWVDVTVSGIPSGSTATIELIVDFDQDGTADPEDVTFEIYPVTDGVASPNADLIFVADNDGSANGTIQAKLSFWDGDTPVGKFIVRAKGNWGSLLKTVQINPQSTTRSVTGTLKNAAGQGIPGAVWASASEEGTDIVAITAKDGQYTLYFPQAGTYQLGGFAWEKIVNDNSSLQVTVPASGQVSNINPTLAEGTTTIAGKVTDASSGAVLAGLKVFAEGTDWSCEVFTNAQGNFVIPSMTGQVFLEMESEDLAKRGFVNGSGLQVNAPGGGLTGQQIHISKADSYISGRVYRRDTQAALTGVGVRAYTQLNGTSTHTVDNGRYALGVQAAMWDVALNNTDLSSFGLMPSPQKMVEVYPQESVTDEDFILYAANVTARVFVVNDQEDPLPNFWVWVTDENWNYVMGVDTDSEGTCSIGLTAGCYHIGLDDNAVSQAGYAPVAAKEVCFVTGEVKDVTFTLSQGIEVKGTVTRQDNGNPIGGTYVTAYSATQAWSFVGMTTTLADGTYTLILNPGNYKITAGGGTYYSEFYNEKPGDWNQADVLQVSEPLSGIDFTLYQGGMLKGTVVRADNSQPLTSADITLYDSNGNQIWNTQVNQSDAGFAILLPPNDYRMSASPNASGLVSETYYDRKDSLNDADMIHVLGGQTNTITIRAPKESTENPDVNKDGVVDGNDMLLIQKYWHQNWPQ